MPADAVPGMVVLAGLAAALAAVAWNARGWLAGRRAAVDVWGGLADVPRRYLVFVHEAVARDPASGATGRDGGTRTALMHALTAGGFVSATVLIVLVHALGLGGAAAAWLLLVALAVMAAGVAIVFSRRVTRALPPRLSRGPFDRLPWALGGFVIFFGWATLPAAGLTEPVVWLEPGSLVLLALGTAASVELYAGLGSGPMRHAANGALHLAFHPRPERFARGGTAATPTDADAAYRGAGAADASGAADAAARPLDLSEPRLGVEQPADFAWNQLLGFDACVQCGRCEAACPARASGQLLDPKQLIQSLAAASRGRSGRAEDPDTGGASLIGGAVDADALWACTTCRACVDECPMMIEHVDAIIDLRRFQTLELGATPGKAGDVLEDLRTTDTASGRDLGARLDWAADLRLPRLADSGRCDVLLWVGEGGFDLRNQRTLRAVVKLLRAAHVDFAILGEEELDCGDLARRLGDEATFQDLARRNIATLHRYAFERILTADPHVLHTVGSEYPAFGGRFTVEHHTSYLARLIRDGRLKPARGDAAASVTYHDPCYLGRYQGEFDAPREILAAIGTDVREMERSRQGSSCCGWGGGAAFADMPGERRIPDVRVEHAQATGADTLAVACPNCAVMLEGVVHPRPEVSDVAELLWARMEGSA